MSPHRLTPAERRVRRAFADGREIVFPAGARDPDRTIRAAVLRDLLTGPPPARAAVPALRVAGARITGPLDLANATVDYPMWLRRCHFDTPPDLDSAHTGQLKFTGSVLPGLHAPGARVDGGMHLDACRVHGEVRLDGARIEGILLLESATLSNPGGQALAASAVTVGLDLLGRGMTALGTVRLPGARIAGHANIENARLTDPDGAEPGGVALDGRNLAVGTDFRGAWLQTEGQVDLRGARIGGQLRFMGATLRNPGHVALRVSSVTAAELWLIEAAPIDGLVNLRRARFELIHVEPYVLPGAVRLDGLTYRTLVPNRPARERLDLLSRDEDGYVPFAYEQLAAAYRTIGDDAAARDVLLAKHRRRRALLPSYARIWGLLQDVTVGYGYRPLRAAAWILVLLAAGTVAFGLRHPPPVVPGEAPTFNAFVYTVNLLIPIADFGQARAFDPQGAYQWLAFLLTAAGWILATTVVAGVARVINRGG